MAVQTDPLASGTSTSEGKLTIALCLVGVALESFFGVLTQQVDTHPNVQWLGIASLVVGATVQLFAILGYSKNRSLLKSNAIVQALASGVPLMVAAVGNAVLKNIKEPIPTTVASANAIQAAKPSLAAVAPPPIPPHP